MGVRTPNITPASGQLAHILGNQEVSPGVFATRKRALANFIADVAAALTFAAADITNVPSGNIEAEDVQAAINELDAAIALLASAKAGLNEAGTFTKGFNVTPFSAGTKSTGTFTPASADGNKQYITANGAFTLAPPSTPCNIELEVLNGASAGAITTSGFTKVTGDVYNITNTNKFLFYITKTQNYSLLNVAALQ